MIQEVWGKSVYDLATTANKHIENKNYKSALFICTAVMEEMTAALQYADDSNGDIGGCIETAYESLCRMAKVELPGELRTTLFEYCLTSYQSKLFYDWDWHLGMLILAGELLENNEETDKVLLLLENFNDSEYSKEQAQRIKFEILMKTKGVNQAEKFLKENISNPVFRRHAIATELENKNYVKAIELSQHGIQQDLKSKPGLAKEWYDWLLKIAQAQNDKENIIKYARYLFMDNFRNEQDYYQLLKSNVAVETWNTFLEEIIKELKARKPYWDTSLVSQIFIKEEWWDRLLEVVQKNPKLQFIEEFEKYLSKDFAVELIGLYANAIISYMKENMGRNHYQTACRYLRRMIKLGGRITADKIISDFRVQYPQRKALIEELNRV